MTIRVSTALHRLIQQAMNRSHAFKFRLRPPCSSLTGIWPRLALIFVIAGPIGCSDLLKQPASAKALFSIEPGLPDSPLLAVPATTTATGPVLQIRSVRVSAPFDGTAFVYELAPSQYALDYYNNFVAPPSALLSEALLAWLEKAGPLPTVGAGTSVRSDLMLECEITKLLIDFSDRTNPQAVISSRFLLYSNRTGTTQVLLDRSYEVSKPLTFKSPAGYSAAWGLAFRDLLQKFDVDLLQQFQILTTWPSDPK
jgi:ABC-type uncharacterized transport system auxiliary subunit